MEDLFAAGGVDAVLRELKPLLDLTAMTVTGETLGQWLDKPPVDPVDRNVVKSREEPIEGVGGLVALFGSLAPGGAILKRSAADSRLFEHTGRAIVFSSLQDLADRIDSEELDVGADDILVLQNAGPASEAAMPEAGYLPIPKKLAKTGIKDMIRISDARMSGTAYGAVILHVTPDAATGGPLGLVETGDRIRLSVKEKRIDLLVDDATLEKRRAALPKPKAVKRRGYDRLYHAHILQADEGCDFDFC
jgi:dihydroxy-acid dehydratase